MTTVRALTMVAVLSMSGCGTIENRQLVGTWESTARLSPSQLSELVGPVPDEVRTTGRITFQLVLFDDGRFSQFATMTIGGLTSAKSSAVAYVLPDFIVRLESHGGWKVTAFDELRLSVSRTRAVTVSDRAKALFERHAGMKTSMERGRETLGGKVAALSADEFTLRSDVQDLVYRRVRR